MFEKVKNVGTAVIDAVKSANIGTVGKIAGGVAGLVGAIALIVAASGSSEQFDSVEYAETEVNDDSGVEPDVVEVEEK